MFVADSCPPGTAVVAEQAVAEADQRRQELVPEKSVADHILGTAEVVGVRFAGYSLLNTEDHTAVGVEVALAAAEHYSQPAADTAGTSGLHSDLLVSELLDTVAVAAEHQAGELQMRRKQCYQVFLNGLLQEH